MSELVSICIPVYNGERFLKESIECVLHQSYRHIEVLIVDDQSTDSTLSIAESFKKSDNRVRIIKNEANLGLVGNWNKCLSEAAGKWIKLHFQDDLMEQDTIARMVRMSIENDLGLVLTDREFFYEDGIKNQFVGLKRLSDFFSKPSIIEPEKLTSILATYGIRDNFMGEPILGLMKTDIATRLGTYDDQFKHIVDFEYWLRIGLNERIGFMPEKLHRFRIHDSSQGAKNVSRPGRISVADRDKMNLVHKFMTAPEFSNFRKTASSDLIKKFLEEHIIERAIKIGQSFIDKEMEPYLVAHIPTSLRFRLRAQLNELLHIIGLKFRV